MAAHRRNIAVVCGLVVLAAAAGCDRARTRGPSGVTTTSATVRPEARPSHPRTVDAAGFVDNAGRTSSETSRSELSGMRATEMGSERLTGTPGTGLPIPIEPDVAEIESGERPRPPAAGRTTPGGTPDLAVTGRVVQALCDRENSCGRIGTKEHASWPTLATCTSKIRPIVREDLTRSGCPDGHAPAALATCLSAIRLASCEKQVEGLGSLPECDARALCVGQ